jgi:hypothetical protein
LRQPFEPAPWTVWRCHAHSQHLNPIQSTPATTARPCPQSYALLQQMAVLPSDALLALAHAGEVLAEFLGADVVG